MAQDFQLNVTGNVSLCPGDFIELISPFSTGNTWSTGEITNNIFVNSSQTISCTHTDADGNILVSEAIMITVLNAANQSINASNGFSLCTANPSTTLTLAETNVQSVMWSTGSTALGILVNAAGIYSATFVNNEGCTTQTQIVEITENEIEVQLISSNTNFSCSGDVTTLSTIGAFNNYLWNTGETAPTITVSQPGEYWVSVTNNTGCEGTSEVFEVIAISEEIANITIIGSTLLCPDETVTFQGDAGFGYVWSTGANTQSITVSEPGFYTLSIIDQYGCQSLPQLVTVTFFDIEAPTVTATGPFEFCSDTSLVLEATWNEEYDFIWSTGETTVSIEITQSGTYYATTSNLIGCESFSPSFTVTAGSALVAEIISDGNNIICPGSTTTLSAGNGSTYLWSTGETTESIEISEPGIYELSVFDENNCLSAPSSIEITQPDLYDAALIPNGPPIFCAGTNITIAHNLPFFYDVVWQDGVALEDTTVTESGTFYIIGTEQDSGCTIYSDTLVVEVGEPTAPEILIIGDTVSCTGEDSLSLNSTPAFAYLWNTGSVEQGIAVYEDGPYFVTTIDDFGCTTTSDTVYYEIDTTFNALPINGPQFVELNTFYTYSYPVETGNTLTWTINGGSIDFPNEDTISVYWESFQNAELCANYTSAFDCFNESICLNINMFVGIEDADDFDISVWPNPSNGIIKYNVDQAEKINTIELYSSFGQLINKPHIHSNNQIDLSAFSNGIYLVRFVFDDFVIDRKILIEK